MNQIMDRFADKTVANELLPKHPVSINHSAASRCKSIVTMRFVESFESFADWKNDRWPGRFGYGAFGERSGQVRIAREHVIAKYIVPHRIAVVAAEPVAPAISIAPELSVSRRKLHFAGVGADSQIVMTDVQFLACLDGDDFPVAVTVGQM